MLDPLRQFTEVLIAWSQLTPSVANADDRAAIKAIVRQTLALHPTAVNEIVFAGAAKPVLRAAFLGRGVSHMRLAGVSCV
jgi:hypothetical protein